MINRHYIGALLALINRHYIGALLALLLMTACQSNFNKKDLDLAATPNVAEQFLSAYNAHDKNQMLKLVHPEIKYMYIDADQIYTETNNKEALSDFLLNFFQTNPKAQSRLISSHIQGPFIHQVEQALWQDSAGQHKSQCSLSVYQTKHQQIINIWYFSAYKCPHS